MKIGLAGRTPPCLPCQADSPACARDNNAAGGHCVRGLTIQ